MRLIVSEQKNTMQAMIIPGNGNTDISENWFPYAKNALEKLGIRVIAENMPDPDLARMRYWLPFIEKRLGGDRNAILIGHSSGAVAVLRYLETHRAEGAVIVGACHTDLGDEKDKAGGYYESEWQWDAIKRNVSWIVQFASIDDPYIPIEEARFIKQKLGTEYYEYKNQGHFGADVRKRQFPKLIDAISQKLNKKR
jgi:hypothetical protein